MNLPAASDPRGLRRASGPARSELDGPGLPKATAATSSRLPRSRISPAVEPVPLSRRVPLSALVTVLGSRPPARPVGEGC